MVTAAPEFDEPRFPLPPHYPRFALLGRWPAEEFFSPRPEFFRAGRGRSEAPATSASFSARESFFSDASARKAADFVLNRLDHTTSTGRRLRVYFAPFFDPPSPLCSPTRFAKSLATPQ
jgi:hypothetical protein